MIVSAKQTIEGSLTPKAQEWYFNEEKLVFSLITALLHTKA